MKPFFYSFTVLILIGIADAGYLSLTTYFSISPVCGPLHGCDTVAQSVYSRLYGVPLAYLGLAYYFLGACLISSLMHSARARMFASVYALVGALMSVWFMYVQIMLIQALCIYCVISAVVTFLLLPVAWALMAKGKETKLSDMSVSLR